MLDEVGIDRSQPLDDGAEGVRQGLDLAATLRDRQGRVETVTEGGEIARPPAPEAEPREGAGDVGRPRQGVAQGSTKGAVFHQERHCLVAAHDGREVGERPARCSASSLAPMADTVRSMASSRLPVRSPERVRVSSRLARVAASMASVAPLVSRVGGDRAGRAPICVRSI